VEIASAQFVTGLDVLLDAVQHSLFDKKELEREKEVVLEEYRRSLDIPERQLGWAIMELSYKNHPYRRPIIGYEKTIRSFDREAILNYMDKWYTPRQYGPGSSWGLRYGRGAQNHQGPRQGFSSEDRKDTF